MANYTKSFNFRNGVQVDNDNFVVNSNGLVGIGTTIPKEYLLNVYGDTRVTGIVAAGGLNVGVATVGSFSATEASVSGVITAASFSGSAAGLTEIYAIAVDGWYVNSGSISTTSNVGIGSTLPTGNFQVGVAVTINNDGNASYTGIVTALGFAGVGTISASTFVGSGASITTINADNISSGTLSNDRLPSDINVSGIVTASSFSGFGTGLTGINASNIDNGTLSNSRLPSDINVSGVVTAYAFTAYAFSGFGTDLTGINASNIDNGTLSNSRLPSGISISGVVTASNFDGIASTAQSLTGNPSISVSNISVGTGGTALTVLPSGRLGIGTTLPTSEIQVRKPSNSLVEVVSDSGQARISVGQSVGAGKSTGVIRFGNSAHNFDIINNDNEGDINFLLNGNGSAGTGKFSWQNAYNFSETMRLNANGDFSVSGVTTLASSGGITTTGGDLYVNGNVTATNFIGNVSLPSIIASNLNVNTGVSTVTHLNIGSNIDPAIGFGKITLENGCTIGIGTTSPRATLDALGKTTLLGQTGINEDTIDFSTTLSVDGTVSISDRVAIGRTEPLNGGAGLEIHGSNGVSGFLDLYETGVYIRSAVDPAPFLNVSVVIDDKTTVGIGSTQPKAAVDLSLAGKGGSGGQYAYLILPKVTNSERSGFASTESGAIIFNTDTSTFQGYTGIGWTDLH